MESLENGDSSYSCGRVKTEVFKYDDLIRFENATCGRRFFLNMEKETSVFENTRLRVDGQIRFKNVTCGRSLFLNTEKKSPFSKIPGYVWTRPELTADSFI